MDSTPFYHFVQIIQKLRVECPWDREQTAKSLTTYLLEETYEVLDSIEKNSMPELKEELGDLLLQIVLQSIIAAEGKHFEIDDVIKEITEKMIKRHPHVFGEKKLTSANDVLQNWEKIKNKQKILSGIPQSLPALLKAFRTGEKVASLGFDWKNPNLALEKVHEELEEVKNAKSQENLEEEIGDLLFAISSFARLNKINPENALQNALKKFQDRFEKIEQEIKKCQTLEEMEELWQNIK